MVRKHISPDNIVEQYVPRKIWPEKLCGRIRPGNVEQYVPKNIWPGKVDRTNPTRKLWPEKSGQKNRAGTNMVGNNMAGNNLARFCLGFAVARPPAEKVQEKMTFLNK